MNNREDEWNKMKQDYQNQQMSQLQFEQMKEKIKQAKAENRKNFIFCHSKKILASVAAAAVVFIILPNASPAAVSAMSRIPVLSNLVSVVTFRDYQYEDANNSADITVPELSVNTEDFAETEDDSVLSQTKKSADEINAEIQTITDKFIQEFEAEKRTEDGYQNMTVTSEVIATTDDYFTLKLMCFQSAGSGTELDYYYTINLSTGERVKLADLFTDGSNYLAAISENIKTQMKEQMAEDENVIYWLDSDVPEWDFQSISNDTSFYLNEQNEIVICFNEGDVAPMYMGCVTFTIPNDVLADIRK